MQTRSLQKRLEEANKRMEELNRKYFSEKCRLTTKRNEIAKSTGAASWRMGAEKSFLNEQLQEVQNEIARLKYDLASCRIGDKAKQKIDKLKEELYLVRGEIRNLCRSLDAKRSTIDDVWSKLVKTKRNTP